MKLEDKAFEAFDDCLRIRQQRAPSHRYTGYVCHKIGILMRERGDLNSAMYDTTSGWVSASRTPLLTYSKYVPPIGCENS